MIKGAQKQMIVVRTGSSRYFTEAYFVLRGDVDRKNPHKEGDMLREANRIISDCMPHGGRISPSKRLPFFLLGILTGALTAGLLLILFL